MKNLVLSLFFITLLFCLFFNATLKPEKPSLMTQEKFEYPPNIKSILDAKCWGCHNSEAKNLKAKSKLNFEKLVDLSDEKKSDKLDDILEVLEKGKMPPKKFLEKFPDKKITEEENKTVSDWAKATIDELP